MYWVCYYLSMLGSKLIHVSKRGLKFDFRIHDTCLKVDDPGVQWNSSKCTNFQLMTPKEDLVTVIISSILGPRWPGVYSAHWGRKKYDRHFVNIFKRIFTWKFEFFTHISLNFILQSLIDKMSSCFPHYWLFVTKGHWYGSMLFCLLLDWISCRTKSDLRRCDAHVTSL